MKRIIATLLAIVLTLTSVMCNPVDVRAEEIDLIDESSQITEEVVTDDEETYGEFTIEAEEPETLEEQECLEEGEVLEILGTSETLDEQEDMEESEGYELESIGELTVTCDSVSKQFSSYSSALSYMKNLGSKDITLKVSPNESYDNTVEITSLPENAKSLKLTSYQDDSDEQEGDFEIKGVTSSVPLILESDTYITNSNLSSVKVLDNKREYASYNIRLKNAEIGILETTGDTYVSAFGTTEHIETFKGKGTIYSSMSGDDPSTFIIDKLDNEDGILCARYTRDDPYEGEVIITVKEGLVAVDEVVRNNDSLYIMAVKDNDDGSKSIVLAPDPSSRVKMKIQRDGDNVILDTDEDGWKHFGSQMAINNYISGLDADTYADCDFTISIGDDCEIPPEKKNGREHLLVSIDMPAKAKSVNFVRNEKYAQQDYQQRIDINYRKEKIDYVVTFQKVSTMFWESKMQNVYNIKEVNFWGESEGASYDYSMTSLDIYANCNIGELKIANAGYVGLGDYLTVGKLVVGDNVVLCSEVHSDIKNADGEWVFDYGVLRVTDETIFPENGRIYIDINPEYLGQRIVPEGTSLFIFEWSSEWDYDVDLYVREGYSPKYDIKRVHDEFTYCSYKLVYPKDYKWELEYTLEGTKRVDTYYDSGSLMDRIYELNNYNTDYYITITKLNDKWEQMKIGEYKDIPAKSLTIECRDSLALGIWNLCEGDDVPPLTIKNTNICSIGDCHLSSLNVINSRINLTEGYRGEYHNIFKEVKLDDKSYLSITSGENSFGTFTGGKAYIDFDFSNGVYGLPHLTINEIKDEAKTFVYYVDTYDLSDYVPGTEILTIKGECTEAKCQNEDELKYSYGYFVNNNLDSDGILHVSLTQTEPVIIPKYTVTFNPMGGKLPEGYSETMDIPQTGLNVLPIPELNLEGSSKKGFKFAGWYKSTAYNKKDIVESIPANVKTNYVLYAKWIPMSYKIEYDKNDENATGSMTASVVSFYEKFTLPANSFKNPGAFFAGWSEDKDASSATYNDKGIVENLADIEGSEEQTVKLYAIWKKVINVEMTLNGGSVSGETPIEDKLLKQLDYGTEYKLPEAVKTGYTFNGWYDFATDKKVTKVAKSQKTDLQLTAKWTPYYMNIKFDKNGGSGSMNAVKAEYGPDTDTINLTGNTFTKKGYDFAGWSTSKKGTVEYTDEQAFPLKNFLENNGNKKTITLYAVWTPAKYKVEFFAADVTGIEDDWFNGNGYTVEVTEPRTIKYTYGKTYVLPTPKSPTPALSGYTFAGWYTDGEYKTAIKKISATTDGNLQLYAKWDTDYTINFYPGGDDVTGTMKSQKMKYATQKALNANKFVRKGYAFVGWGFSANGEVAYTDKEKVLRPGDHFTNIDDEKFMSLYAQWENKFPVTFYLNGGSMDGAALSEDNGYVGDPSFLTSSVETYYAYDKNHVLPTPTKENYTFAGWYTTEGLKTSGKLPQKSTGEICLYAKWDANYNVVFDGNGDDVTGTMKNQSMKYSVEKALTANKYAKPGYVFMGWSLVPTGEAIYANKAKIVRPAIDFENENTLKLYAVWQNKFKVTYVLNGGKLGETSEDVTEDYTYGENHVLPAPTKENYTFAGWYKDEALKSKASFNKNSSGDVIFYAKWTPVTGTIKFSANGGKGSAKAVKADYSIGNFKLPTGAFTKAGYIFAGWSTEADGSVIYSNEEMVAELNKLPLASGEKNYTLYALWTKEKYTITYHDAEVSVEWPAEYFVDTDTISLPSPYKFGYTFGGWYSDANYKTKVLNIKKGSTGNKDFYAKWILNK